MSAVTNRRHVVEVRPADHVWASRIPKLQVQARQPGGGGEPPPLNTHSRRAGGRSTSSRVGSVGTSQLATSASNVSNARDQSGLCGE